MATTKEMLAIRTRLKEAAHHLNEAARIMQDFNLDPSGITAITLENVGTLVLNIESRVRSRD